MCKCNEYTPPRIHRSLLFGGNKQGLGRRGVKTSCLAYFIFIFQDDYVIEYT